MREVRSFAGRQGRMSKSRRQSFAQWQQEQAWQKRDWSIFFQEKKDVILEIGFGNGESLIAMAQAEPWRHFIGIDSYPAGVSLLLQRLEQHPTENLTVLYGDALVFLAALPEAVLAGIQVYFPDPWPKVRHWPRRLVQSKNLPLLVSRLKLAGFLHTATDWADYAKVMQQTFAACPLLYSPTPGCQRRPVRRPETAFERRGRRLGHDICDLIYWRLF
jgi:tRNA (guanine-N7-)-methyltransferase